MMPARKMLPPLLVLIGLSAITAATANGTTMTTDSTTVTDASEYNYTALVYYNESDYELGHGMKVNASRHAGFVHGFVESLSVILVSEIGDKTFFIATIMAMTSNKLTIFLAAITALAAMTVLSALLGWVVTSIIPRVYTYYACTAIMFVFGFKMFWDAWRMKPDEMEELQHEVEEELNRRGSIVGSGSISGNSAPAPEAIALQENGSTNAGTSGQEVGGPFAFFPSIFFLAGDNNPCKEKSVFGKRCYKYFKLFVNCFVMTFLAEWGDRSQLATIVLASVNDVAGVCLGGVVGHSCCTGVAVIAGSIVARKVSVRVVTVVGAVIFVAFAVASLFFDPESEHMIKIDL